MERLTVAEYRKLLADKPSKYNAKKTKVDGITFDSAMEADYYCELKLRHHIGEINNMILQPRYILQESPKIEYVADFLVTYPDGRTEVIDVKGMQTQAFRVKLRLFKGRYPDYTLKLVTRKNGVWEEVIA